MQNGAVAFLQGFGVRERGRPQPVTPDTLMGVGSATKSFTTTLAATLVDAGRLRWDSPVVEPLPEFTLSDPEVAEYLTLADLFSAASGLPRRDLELVFEPAAGRWSSAREMARYLQMQLAGGVAVDGTRVVLAENLERTWQPGVFVPPAP